MEKKFVITAFVTWLIMCITTILVFIHFPHWIDSESNTAIRGILYSLLMVIPSVGIAFGLG